MHTTFRFAILALILTLVGLPVTVQAQTLANTTTLSAAITASQTSFQVASTTNITAGTSKLFVPITGEIMEVLSKDSPASGWVKVRRGVQSFPIRAPASATVVIAVASHFGSITYGGACTRGTAPADYLPQINQKTGDLCSCRGDSRWYCTNGLELVLDSITPFTP